MLSLSFEGQGGGSNEISDAASSMCVALVKSLLSSSCHEMVTADNLKPARIEVEIAAADERNSLSGQAERQAQPWATGGQIVQRVGNGLDNSLTWNDVEVPAAGVHSLTFHYFAEENRDCYVSVNGDPAEKHAFPATGGWDAIPAAGHKTVEVTLQAGKNTIRVENAEEWAPLFDKLEVHSQISKDAKAKDTSKDIMAAAAAVGRFVEVVSVVFTACCESNFKEGSTLTLNDESAIEKSPIASVLPVVLITLKVILSALSPRIHSQRIGHHHLTATV